MFPENDTAFFIPGPVGRLESLFFKSPEASNAVAVICHPHPLKEGTMHNKVVHTLSRAFTRKGFHTVRFNYRGVGNSEGSYGDSVGETADLMAVIAWVKQEIPDAFISLAGFSFGAYIAAMGATQLSCQQLISVAPAIGIQPYNQLPPIKCPWTIFQGEKDEVIDPEQVYQWFESAHPQAIAPMNLIKLPDASHFFHGKLIVLRDLIEETLISL